jgi:hypothetical protein
MPQEESTLEYLARRLQDVKRIKPNPAPVQKEERVDAAKNGATNLATPTMAEIFVGQGAYAEAISAYTELLRQHPQEERYKQRLTEIERLMKLDSSTK